MSAKTFFEPSRHIDHGFYRVSDKEAGQLARSCKQHGFSGSLPEHGKEKLVKHGEQYLWLARTTKFGETIWSVRDAGSWRFDKGFITTAPLPAATPATPA